MTRKALLRAVLVGTIGAAATACSLIAGIEEGTYDPSVGASPDGAPSGQPGQEEPATPDASEPFDATVGDDAGDATVPGKADAPATETGVDADAGQRSDGGPPDALDARADATLDADASPEASADATVDVMADAPAEAALDAPADVVDASPADTGPACSSERPDPNIGVFVTTAGNDTPTGTTCGSMTVPCRTITAGLARAKANARAVVYVAAGTYVEDGVALFAGVTVQGGWSELGGAWSRICTADRRTRVVLRPASGNTTVRAAQLGGTATLDTLTLGARTAPAAAGESLYGLFATGTTTVVVLNDAQVESAAAGSSQPPAQAAPGAPVTGTCTANDGAAGADGLPGGGAVIGGFSASGYTPAAGSSGADGTGGNNGAAAAAPNCLSCLDPAGTCNAGTVLRCTQSASSGTTCGKAGASGCGGKGGTTGAGGSGGGTSVAVFAWDATISSTGGLFQAGNGGNGASGGFGGLGSQGTAGTTGAPGPTCTGCGYARSDAGVFFCSKVNISGAGTAGGTGGNGGSGGQGGGGAGGASFAIYRGGSARASTAGTTLVHGAGGQGGPGGNAFGQGAPGSFADIGP